MKATHVLVGSWSWEESTIGHGGGGASETIAEFSSREKAEAYLEKHRVKLRGEYDALSIKEKKKAPFDPE